MSSTSVSNTLVSPGESGGILAVFSHRYLLRLVVKKEIQLRYRGSIMGWIWSYVKPLVQFLVFYFAVGVFLGMSERVEFFPIYLLAGTTIIGFFSEAFANGTRSLVDNAALIKKIYLPREMFPLSSTLVAAINTGPQIAVVMVIAALFGWRPSPLDIALLLLAFANVAILATGLGMLFGSVNVSFRDAQSFVEVILMCAVWASPVMYQWEQVRDTSPPWLFDLYRANPLTSAVELFHVGIWMPLEPAGGQIMPGLFTATLLATVVGLVLLAVGQIVFRSMEGRFAQDL